MSTQRVKLLATIGAIAGFLLTSLIINTVLRAPQGIWIFVGLLYLVTGYMVSESIPLLDHDETAHFTKRFSKFFPLLFGIILS